MFRKLEGLLFNFPRLDCLGLGSNKRKENSHFSPDKTFYFSKSDSLLKAFPSDRYHFSFLPSILLPNLNSLRLTLHFLTPLSAHLLSFHCCLKVIWTLNSILTSSIFSKLLTNKFTRTVVGPSGSVRLRQSFLSSATRAPLGLKNQRNNLVS